MRCANHPTIHPSGPQPLCYSSIHGETIRFPKPRRCIVLPASDALGCPVHRVQSPELAPRLVGFGRDSRGLHQRFATPCCGTASRRVLLNRERRCLRADLPNLPLKNPTTPQTPNLVPNHYCDFPWPTRAVPVVDLSRRVGSPTSLNGSRICKCAGLPGKHPRVARLQKYHLASLWAARAPEIT